MKKILLTIMAISLLGANLKAQDGWNWPEDSAKKAKAMEKNALYTDMLNAENYEAAKPPLAWLLRETPDLNESIYIQGVKIYEALAESTTGQVQENMQDSTVLLYDLRIKYFNDEENVTNRKAWHAYTMWKKRRDKYEELFNIEKKAFEMVDPVDLITSNLVGYMDATRLHKASGGSITDLQAIEIYDKIQEAFEKKLEAGESAQKITTYRNYVDKVFSLTVKITCELINDNLYPKYQENPDDMDLAKKIVSFSLSENCTDSEAFIETAKVVSKESPDFGLIRFIAVKAKSSSDYETAKEYFEQALDLTEDNIKKGEVYLELADIAGKQGQKATARSYAYKAVEADPTKKEAYIVIGDMYLKSGEQCKEGKDVVKDRAVYLAAYKMYQKAGNASRMATAKEQFPSKEDVFNYGYEVGQSIEAGCWIGETVTVQTRD